MSYFNREQREYMAELAATPHDQLAWCGWGRVGKCGHPECPTDKTRADYLAAACPLCFTLPPVHVLGCALDAACVAP